MGDARRAAFGFLGPFLLLNTLRDAFPDDVCKTTAEGHVCTTAWATEPGWWVLLVVTMVGPFVTTVVLLRELRRHRRATAL